MVRQKRGLCADVVEWMNSGTRPEREQSNFPRDGIK